MFNSNCFNFLKTCNWYHRVMSVSTMTSEAMHPLSVFILQVVLSNVMELRPVLEPTTVHTLISVIHSTVGAHALVSCVPLEHFTAQLPVCVTPSPKDSVMLVSHKTYYICTVKIYLYFLLQTHIARPNYYRGLSTR